MTEKEIRVGMVFGSLEAGDFVIEPCSIEDCEGCYEHYELDVEKVLDEDEY